MDSLNSWAHYVLASMEGDSPILQSVGRWSYKLYEEREMVLMYIHLLLSALFPIYIGSHASLHCPLSAEDPAKKKALRIASTDSEDDDDEFDDLEAQSTVEGLSPSDAILFPVFASITLGVLYFLIKWMNDPALLNKILGWYFSLIGVFGVGKLAGDALNVGTTVIFPSVWASRNDVFFVDPLLSQQFTNSPVATGLVAVPLNRAPLHRKFADKNTPLPGVLSNLKFSDSFAHRIWSIRALFTNHWIFRGYVHGLINFKGRIRLNDVIGLLFGIASITMYNASGKPWWLTNLMGFGFCYGTLQIMSPTTFWTGSLVLAGLFVYDIVMVFYTPLMITVATSLDVPIKLVFPGPKRGGMLGLGDVVLPGIMMALALRFDLYLYYLRKPAPPASSHSLTPNANPKPAYEKATGLWGDRFWTRSAKMAKLPANLTGAAFPKVYFYASVIGYVLGMLATLVVLNVFNHAQPALLYLVPGVLGALWGTALVKGELGLMWNYTEAGTEEEEDKEAADKGKDEKNSDKTEEEKKADEKAEEEKKEKEKQLANEHAHHVFLFSVSSPRHGPKKSKLFRRIA